MSIPQWVSNYIGIPYKDKGSDHNGCDCWGLYRLIQKEQFGLDLPEYAYLSANETQSVTTLVDQVRVLWELPMNELPITGDIILLRILGERVHIGMYVEDDYVLHTLNQHAAVLERIGPKWHGRIEGYGRWRS